MDSRRPPRGCARGAVVLHQDMKMRADSGTIALLALNTRWQGGEGAPFHTESPMRHRSGKGVPPESWVPEIGASPASLRRRPGSRHRGRGNGGKTAEALANARPEFRGRIHKPEPHYKGTGELLGLSNMFRGNRDGKFLSGSLVQYPGLQHLSRLRPARNDGLEPPFRDVHPELHQVSGKQARQAGRLEDKLALRWGDIPGVGPPLRSNDSGRVRHPGPGQSQETPYGLCNLALLEARAVPNINVAWFTFSSLFFSFRTILCGNPVGVRLA